VLPCKEVASAIASDGFAERSWRQRLGLRLHLMMCRHCREYARQIRALGVLSRLVCAEDEPDEAHLRRLEVTILDRIDTRPPPG
jgi:hypothetical protein